MTFAFNDELVDNGVDPIAFFRSRHGNGAWQINSLRQLVERTLHNDKMGGDNRRIGMLEDLLVFLHDLSIYLTEIQRPSGIDVKTIKDTLIDINDKE